MFWTSNKTAWVTKTNFEHWFRNSFIPEVREYLAKKNLALKVLLLLDNYKSYDESLQVANPDVEVIFLPPNTTSLIQPLDQSVIATLKSYYLRRVVKSMVQKVNLHRSCENFAPDNVVKNFWRSFFIVDSINFVNESWKGIKSTTITGSWEKIFPSIPNVNQETNQAEFPEVVQEIVNLAREVDGEGFADIEDRGILDLVITERENYTPDQIEECRIILRKTAKKSMKTNSMLKSLSKL